MDKGRTGRQYNKDRGLYQGNINFKINFSVEPIKK